MKRLIIIVFVICNVLSLTAQQTYSLEQILEAARENNVTVRNARRDVDAAHQTRKEALTKYFPSISGIGTWFNANRGMAKTDINLSETLPPELGAAMAQSFPPEALMALANPISISMMKNGTIAGITAMQPVFAGGQIVNGNKLAKVGEEVSQLQLHLSENEVKQNAEKYFWQLVSLQEKIKTVHAVEDLLTDIHKNVKVAVEAGITMRNDLLQVQLRQNDIESQKIKLQHGISIVKMLMAQYCGLQDTTFVLTYDNKAISPINLRKDHQQALLGTSEYQLLNKQVEAMDLQYKMEIGKNLPSVAVGAGYNYHNLLENDRTFSMVFASVSVPISDWWGGSYAIKHKKLEKLKAEDQLENDSEMLKIRMMKAWHDVEEAFQQLEIAERSISQAQENLRLNRDYYQAGTSTMSDLLEAQLLYQQSLDRRTESFAEYQNRILEYRQSIGE